MISTFFHFLDLPLCSLLFKYIGKISLKSTSSIFHIAFSLNLFLPEQKEICFKFLKDSLNFFYLSHAYHEANKTMDWLVSREDKLDILPNLQAPSDLALLLNADFMHGCIFLHY